jgi:glycerol-3-phosphate acyltransferase PlsX
MKVALDAMGGDNAPAAIIEGAAQALKSGVSIERIFLVGAEDQIRPLLEKFGIESDPRVEVVHASQVVEMHESPADAIRRKKDASISRAVDLVKKGEAQAIVTAGHTGAAVVATTLKLRTLPGVERPAIATVFPHPHGLRTHTFRNRRAARRAAQHRRRSDEG